MRAEQEVIVIGGGPGGAACAATLARGGRHVLLLDKASFPRDHVGESLSPQVLDTAERLGISQELRAARFAAKAGATFAWGDDPWPWTVAYQAATQPPAYQVRRAEFDAILLQAATAGGADVRLGWRADDIVYSSGQPVSVLATAPDGRPVRLAAPWVVDASGTAGLLSHRLERVAGPPELDRVAVWGYWRRDGHPDIANAGNSLLIGRRDACLWHYPLDDEATLASVGVVVPAGAARRVLTDPPEAFYRSAVGSFPELLPLLSGAVLDSEVHAADACAYVSPQLAGSGWFLVGDAACFVDSLLTPGVQLAIQHGTLAAQCLQTILTRRAAEPAVLDLYDRVVRREYETFTRLSCNLYRAADNAGEPVSVPRQQQAPRTDGQFAFLSLISGLPRTELAAQLGAYMAARKRAAALGGLPVVLGEKEGFAFLAWLFHQDELARSQADRAGSVLDEDCLVLPASGAGLAEELFIPVDNAQILTGRLATANRLGDRFEATPELVTLFEVLDGGCRYEEARRRFCAALTLRGGDYEQRFRDWIELLADHALVEWKPAGEVATCAP
jgi:flavin-dependent dehydrogenase